MRYTLTCLDCNQRSFCKEPCAWLEAQLKKSTKERNRNEIAIPIDVLEDLQNDLPTPQEMAGYFSEGKVAFPELSPLQNKLFKAFYFDGLSYRQMAQLFNLKVDTVRKALYRAKKRLKGVWASKPRQ